MNTASAWTCALAFGALAALPACRQPKSAASSAPAASPATAKTYPGHGVIRGFQADGKVVVIEHRAIPGLMEGMTMGFELADPALAKGFKAGDTVDFNLSVAGDDWTIESMQESR
jgi:Cu/Ag efflux protein CusF